MRIREWGEIPWPLPLLPACFFGWSRVWGFHCGEANTRKTRATGQSTNFGCRKRAKDKKAPCMYWILSVSHSLQFIFFFNDSSSTSFSYNIYISIFIYFVPPQDQWSMYSSWAMFSAHKIQTLALCKKKIFRHIKLAVHVWSTKCWRNQKLIAQFGCTLRDERFEPN